MPMTRATATVAIAGLLALTGCHSPSTPSTAATTPAAQPLATPNPGDGEFPYSLAVALPNACQFHQTLNVDGTLIVSNDSLRFGVATGDLALNIARTQGSIKGTISGRARLPLFRDVACTLSVYNTFNVEFNLLLPAVLSGTVDANGGLAGGFTGYAECVLSYERQFRCPEQPTPGYSWTLTPR
jgi:hypothetical protein